MVKLGLVGANEITRKHLECLAGMSEFDCIGLYDHNHENAKQFRDKTGIKFYNDFRQMISDADAVLIETPVGMHYRYASAAIMGSTHVMLSGLISEDIHEARHINELAIEAQVNVKVLHTDKLRPEIKSLKRAMKKPVYVECNRFQNKVLSISNDSIIFGALVSDIELLGHLINSKVRKVSTNASQVFNDFVDFVNVRIDYENGCVANMNCGNFENGENSHIKVIQSGECIKYDLNNHSMSRLIRSEMGDIAEVPSCSPRTKQEDVIKIELQQFASSILNRQKTMQETYQAFDSLRIAHLIIEKFHPSTLFNA